MRGGRKTYGISEERGREQVRGVTKLRGVVEEGRKIRGAKQTCGQDICQMTAGTGGHSTVKTKRRARSAGWG